MSHPALDPSPGKDSTDKVSLARDGTIPPVCFRLVNYADVWNVKSVI
jgi:hypothetical protein